MATGDGESPRTEERPANVGAQLREARERRGLSIYAIADATKISTATLLAIERNDIKRLPAGLYTRGHVRAYAAEVGLDPQSISADYLAQFEPPPSEAPVVPVEPPPPAVDQRAVMGIAVIGGVLACGIALLLYWLVAGRSSGDNSEAAAEDIVQAEGLTDASDASPPGTDQPATARKALRLEVTPNEACWVSIRADGQLMIFRVMRRGEREVFEADNSFVVNVGNAGAFVYRINGAAGRVLGEPGAVVTVRITEDTYRSFLVDASDLDTP